MKTESGNVVVYLLVGLVLFVVMMSGIWWVKQRSHTVTPPTPTVTQTTDESPETAVDQDAVSQQRSTDNSSRSASRSADSQPTTPTQPAQSPQSSTSNSTSPTTTPSRPESQTPRTGPSPTAVASSGPTEDRLFMAAGLGMVAFFGTSYARSRRQRALR